MRYLDIEALSNVNSSVGNNYCAIFGIDGHIGRIHECGIVSYWVVCWSHRQAPFDPAVRLKDKKKIKFQHKHKFLLYPLQQRLCARVTLYVMWNTVKYATEEK